VLSTCVFLLSVLSAPVSAQLEAARPLEGPLLAQASLADNLHVGVYGPQTVTTDEPALFSLLISGDHTTRIRSGLVFIASSKGTIHYRQSPPPAGWYIPSGQWAPDDKSEWRQFLLVQPRSRWASRVMAMAHINFRGGAGELLDAVVADPTCPGPPEGPAFRDTNAFDQVGVVFVSDEHASTTADLHASKQADKTDKGAHGIRVSIPLVIKDQAAALSVWIVANVNGQYLSQTLSLLLAPQTGNTQGPETGDTAPVIDTPLEGDTVTGTIRIDGRTKPGVLAVAWCETYAVDNADQRTAHPPIRRITDEYGYFSIPLPVPKVETQPDQTVLYELHVRSGAPAYKSPETIRKLTVKTAQ